MNIGTVLKTADTVVKVTTLSMLAAKAAMVGLIMWSDHQKNKASV
jgi:hypothetical protein